MPAFLARSAKILIVFAIVGPLVGLLAFALGAGAMTSVSGYAEGMWLTPFLLLYGLLFAHVAGVPWALVAGLCTSLVVARVADRGLWIGAASGVVSFATAALFKSVQVPFGTASLHGAPGDSFMWGIAAVMLLVHVVAATVSWWIARRFA